MAPTAPKLTALGLFRLLLVILWTLFCLILATPFRLIAPPIWWWFPTLWMTVLLKIFGLKVTVSGKRVKDQAVLFVSNHISWQDIMIYGAVIKHVSFISKAEVSRNPISRFVAGYQKTLFIERKKRSHSKKQNQAMADRIAKGDNLVLFPEGRTTRGVHVDPFKTSLFAVLEMLVQSTCKPQVMQPVSICYTHANNFPILIGDRAKIGLIGRGGGLAHFIRALNRRSTRVRVDFHDPITVDTGMSRKDVAKQAEAAIREGLSQGHRQRG